MIGSLKMAIGIPQMRVRVAAEVIGNHQRAGVRVNGRHDHNPHSVDMLDPIAVVKEDPHRGLQLSVAIAP
ncbi:MAG: hypothetical protein IH985_06245 [Planctomycetes bacterium]|nr:hypothetical protein [Planctomycetota bacterium]